ncbi:response regulator transcription factor [Heliophilum fasciatum]|uniref:Stage 0 sporulation protein A homolog n=1 Tax=Heliophilum fasciatum TaxID=35700 RepID=A0A4R2R9I1_9FIRM|nr:response regulator transcription factor [Heliophilum fasciatum]MCW2279501.1 DNA-binding response OmpR family regulator [Heliophilum fasciatum]TCP58728.1 winged helix family two component transcriptional regulator [Heliophilum fasciatum]
MNILVCDDDQEIVEAIRIYLENEGYRVLKASDGVEALQVIEAQPVHLIIMDIMMPRMDGLRATLKIREEANIPIIMLSAKSEDTDKIIGLNMGADDYVTKPFNPLELIARVKSQLRRYTTLGSLETRSNVYQTGGLMIDDESKQVTVDGEEVRFTPVQYKILRLLTANAGRVFSIDEIYNNVWEENAYGADNTPTIAIYSPCLLILFSTAVTTQFSQRLSKKINIISNRSGFTV